MFISLERYISNIMILFDGIKNCVFLVYIYFVSFFQREDELNV